MSNSKLIWRVVSLVMIVVCALTFTACYICWHTETCDSIVVKPTCTTCGMHQVRCKRCDKLLQETLITAAGHAMSEYEITQNPYEDTNGIETSYCSKCEHTENKEYICPHNNSHMELYQSPTCSQDGIWYNRCDLCHTILSETTTDKLPHAETTTIVVQEASCMSEGINHEVCVACDTIVNEIAVESLAHSYGDWTYNRYATPFDAGSRSKYCTVCNAEYTESYTMNMPANNSIYIPGTGICGKIIVGELSQSAIDRNDIVYEDGFWGNNGPVVLGHNYGSLKNLHKTKVGQYIYISVNGTITTYKVTVSEYALQNASHTEIYGQTTGAYFSQTVSAGTLKMYTCYGGGEGRWLVFAEKVA